MTRKRSDMLEFLNVKVVFAKITEKCTEVEVLQSFFLSRKLNEKG